MLLNLFILIFKNVFLQFFKFYINVFLILFFITHQQHYNNYCHISTHIYPIYIWVGTNFMTIIYVIFNCHVFGYHMGMTWVSYGYDMGTNG